MSVWRPLEAMRASRARQMASAGAETAGMTAELQQWLHDAEAGDSMLRELSRAEMETVARGCPLEMAAVVIECCDEDRDYEALAAVLEREPLPEAAQLAAMDHGELARLWLAENDSALAKFLPVILEEADENAVEVAALANPNMPAEVLVDRFENGDELDRLWSVGNTAFPLQMSEQAARDDPDHGVRAEARFSLGRQRLANGITATPGMGPAEVAAAERAAASCRACIAAGEGVPLNADSHTEECLEWRSMPEAWADTPVTAIGGTEEAAAAVELRALVGEALSIELARRCEAAEDALVAATDVMEAWIAAGFDAAAGSAAIAAALRDPERFDGLLVGWPQRLAVADISGLEDELRAEAENWWRQAGLGHPEALAALLAAEDPAGIEADEPGLEL